MFNKVYLDHASTTKINKEILDLYKSLLDEYYVNSESLYDDGVKIKQLISTSRETIAELLNVKSSNIIFTSGASESNNFAIKGLCSYYPNRKHIITSKIEHSSVLNCIKQLERLHGYKVTYLDVDNNGHVNLEQLEKAITNDTILVSIMCVNNEIGSLNDIESIKKIVKKYPSTFLHVDAAQGFGKVDIDLTDIDLMSISTHKIHGLKGSGILVKKDHVNLEPLIIAGKQENGLRGGTSNALVNIVFAKTLRLALEDKEKYKDYLNDLKQYLIDELSKITGVHFNSNNDTYIINISTPVKSEILLNSLNEKGIMLSAISTCHSKKTTSYVLEAIGLDYERIIRSVRISIGYENTKEEIDYFIKCLQEVIKKHERF